MTSTDVDTRSAAKEVAPPLSNGFRSLAHAVKTLSRGGMTLTYTGLQIEDVSDFTYDDLEHLLAILGQIHRGSQRGLHALQWAIGDAILFGEGLFGEKCAQAALAVKRSPGTIRNWSSIALRVIPARRRDDLTFTHHEVVAALSPRAQTRWLKLAAETLDEDGRPMGANELRRLIREEAEAEAGEQTRIDTDRPRAAIVDDLVELGRYIATRMQPNGNGGFVIILDRETAARLRAAVGIEET